LVPNCLVSVKWGVRVMVPAYRWREEDPFHFWRFSLLPFQSYWTWYDGK
jgi:hypothetical protein